MDAAPMNTRGPTRALVIVSALVAVVTILPHGPAIAREPSTSLTLLAQTPWTLPDDPATRRVESELAIAVIATNTGRARIGDLEVALSFGEAFVSRFEFEAVVAGGSFSPASTVVEPVAGTLDPGTARTLKLRVDVSDLPTVNPDDSRVYPTLVELRSAGAPIGSLFTPAINLVRTPEQPLRLAWWTEMEGPVAFDPDGRLVDTSLEATIAPGGVLEAQLSALEGISDSRGPVADIDLVIQPSLIEQVERLSLGYERAADGSAVSEDEGPSDAAATFLRRLREVSAIHAVQVSGQPFVGPSIPSLLSSGLQKELGRQRVAGTRILSRLLGIAPASTVARPPGGSLDDATLSYLAAKGATAVLADADEVARPPIGDQGFTPLPTAPVGGSGGGPWLVLPDPATQELFSRTDLLADPLRATQIVVAQLAVIWKEAPIPGPQEDGAPTVRGVAVAPPPTLPPGMWGPLLGRLAGAPFLTPTHAQEFVDSVSPASDQSTLPAPDTRSFSAEYAADVIALRRDAETYASMVQGAPEGPARVRDDLLFAVARDYLEPNEPAGKVWLDDVRAITGAAFAGTTPSVAQLFTFTSREGTIPLRMGDPGPTPLRVTVALRSSQFEFPAGDSQQVVLREPDQILTFDVVAKAAGRNPILVLVLAPSGQVISQQTITVATTTANRIALLVTLAAALGLVVLYVRKRSRQKAAEP